MIGIIYKFTIIAKLKKDSHKPFYIGQHFTTKSSEEFISKKYYYWGSGTIWNKFLVKLRKINPQNWQSFIKREILFSSESITQKGLDALEEFWIKREKAHYSFGIGGCNVLWGATSSPTKDPEVRRKISERMKGKNNPIHKHVFTDKERKKIGEQRRGKCYITDSGRKRISNYMSNRIVSDETKEKIRIANIGENNPNWGKRGEETSMYGHHHSDEFKKRHSERMRGKNHPNYGKPSRNKGKSMSEEQKLKISKALKGRVLSKTVLIGESHPMFGKHHSEETKIKIGKKMKGRKFSAETIQKMKNAAILREKRKRELI